MEERIPADHPILALKPLVDEALKRLSRRFAGTYAATGRPSIAPEKLLQVVLRQVVYPIRSERQLMEQLDYNIWYRWFVGLDMDEAVWDVRVYHEEPRTADREPSGRRALRSGLKQARRA